MRNIVFLFCLFTIIVLKTSAQQTRPYDTYLIEENTYITNPIYTQQGLFFSDNYYSAIYKYDGSQTTIIHQSAGCGRYMQVSPDLNKIGFKIIDENGMQTPAIIDVLSNKIIKLHSPSSQCGQVFFNSEGDVFYTVNETVYIVSGIQTSNVNIGTTCNYIAYSSSRNTVVYSGDNDCLFAFDIASGRSTQITPDDKGCTYPSFSPDGDKLSYNMGEEIVIYNFATSTENIVDTGGGVKWIGNNSFIYNRYRKDSTSIPRADIITWNNGQINNLTHTESISEMQPFPAGNNRMTYHTYDNRSVFITDLTTGGSQLLYQTSDPLPVRFYDIKSNKSDITVPGTVPYIHQVYDTPSWHYGYSSCAPTTSAMSFAYYNQLPPWPVEVDHGYTWDPHINNYGSYVADRYRFNEFYYSISATTGGTTAYGGYGFMWGSKSPNGMMRTYHEQHYHTSNQLWTTSCTFENTTTEIDLGYVHPICNYLTTSGHLTLAIGYVSGQHTLIFNDPYGNKNNPGYPNYTGAGAKYDWPGYNNGYQNLDASGTNGCVAWTVKARYSEISYNDTIIDNNYYNHGFYMNNTQAGSHQRYFRDFNVGYNGHTWYTMTDAGIPDICWVTWTPSLHQSGYYEVFAYIPSNGASTTEAPYKVYHDNGVSTVVVDQSLYFNEWVSLGIYYFSQGLGGHVYLGDSTNVDGDMIAYDAMWWSFRPSANADFNNSPTVICPGDTINFSNNSINATAYSWEFPGGTPSTSSSPNPFVVYNSSGDYNVVLIASNQWSSDTISVPAAVQVNYAPLAGFYSPVTVLSIPNATASFFNESLNANQYLWDFGDGNNSALEIPDHEYLSAGSYTVSLIASNNDCPDDTLIRENYILVDDPTFINTSGTDGYLYYYSGNLTFDLPEEYESLEIFSPDGKKIFVCNVPGKAGSQDLSNLSKGIYICCFSKNENNVIKKYKFCVY